MKIGSYKLKNKVLVAPMAGVTDAVFRRLCVDYGAAMAVSEMVTSNPRLFNSTRSNWRKQYLPDSGLRSVQIVGHDPQKLAHAARYNVDQGAQIIDINMGCPAKKVCNKLAGSALLADESQVARILDAVVNSVDVPVTLKIRTGSDPHNRNGLRIAQLAQRSGIALLSVHGRTRACRFKGAAEYQTIRDIKQSVNIPVVANGDIDSPEKARQVLELTGADAVMIGRSAQGKPWLFKQVVSYLKTGEYVLEPEISEVCEMLLFQLEQMYLLYGEYNGVRIARKHIAWTVKNLTGAAEFRKKINTLESSAQQYKITESFLTAFKPLIEIAA